MRDLILTNTKVRAQGAYFALKFMPNITSLGDFVFATAGLKKFWQESKYKFGLKQVCFIGFIGLFYSIFCFSTYHGVFLLQIFYRGPTCEKVKLIGATCPDLEVLHLGSDDAKRLNLKVYFNLFRTLPLCFLLFSHVRCFLSFLCSIYQNYLS